MQLAFNETFLTHINTIHENKSHYHKVINTYFLYVQKYHSTFRSNTE